MGANQYTSEDRRYRVTIRLKMEERDALASAAKAEGLSVIAFVRKVAMAAALAAQGCFGAGSPNNFPHILASDRETFSNCWPKMRPSICGEDSDGFHIEICRGVSQRRYADKPSSARPRWLVAHGCPKDMVEAAQDDDNEDEEDPR